MTTISLISECVLNEMAKFASETPDGVFVEFGVYRGGSAVVLAEIAEKQGRNIHLFDTFTGIPFRHELDQHDEGDFSDTSEIEVREMIQNAIFHVGVFPETMPEVFQQIAFCHIDADQYKSYKDAIKIFSPLMVKGGIMWFDDVGCLNSADIEVQEAFNGDIEKAKCGKFFKRF